MAVLTHSRPLRGDGRAGTLGGLPSAWDAGVQALEKGRAGHIGPGSGRQPRLRTLHRRL